MKFLTSGKVKDVYELDDGNLLFKFSNRVSAYDVKFKDEIPRKGEVLCKFAEYWFKKLDFPNDGSHVTPSFTPHELQNFNEFIKAVFSKELKRKGYRSTKEAWNDFINHINCFEQWSETCSFRLKESLFIEHADPLTCDEMNQLTKGKRCPCPIRTGLINWINNSDQGKCCCADKSFPSQQVICEKGSNLIDELYGNKS